ncbi:hypothetical protein CTI12_AA362370 [Artemisia annua]|uniref:Uncharacterized protein n=1 Tax=Artemisia annua TaxID=35608 RepID=A0A2U1MN14_ARTAN|nr:hypothetical protein CTI12_AA362370 [Artemisia annua]
MRQVLAVMRRNICDMKKSTKVADENMFRDGNGVEFPVIAHHTRHGWNGLSIIYSILKAPLSLLSCLSSHTHGTADGVWVSGEFSRISDANHLLVNDSMRYAIFM